MGRYIDGQTRTLRGRSLWKKRRVEALERDGYVCQRCGAMPPVELHVHHVLPCRLFGDDAETAHAIDNLTTLCEHCHMTVEAKTQWL
jgi:5-methylcytosine-specific restriction endonuclease McrA